MKKFSEKHCKKIIAAILLFVAIVSILNAKNDSAIFDETAHIGAGYSYVTEQEIRLNPEHPPLIKNLSALPLLFLDLNFDVDKPFWTGELPGKWDAGQWAAGRNLLYESGNNPERILFWSRLPIILLSLLLGWFIFHFTKKLAGTSAGIFALVLYAFDPNILGHNHFVTTDLGIAAFFTFAFYFYLRFIKEPTFQNIALAGIFLGLLQLTKFSFVIGLPILAIVTIIYPLARISRDLEGKNIWKFKLKKSFEYALKGFSALLISLVVVWALYFLNTFRMSEETVARTIDANFPPGQTENIKEVYARQVLNALNGNFLTRPLALYGEGIGYVFKRVAGGNGAYFMQKVSKVASPSYFPTVFILKEPLISLFFMLSALTIAIFSGIKFFSQKFSYHFGELEKDNLPCLGVSSFIRHNLIGISLFSFIALYSYVSITGNLNIGFRHLFPILPFIYILTAKIIFDFLKKLDKHSRMIWRGIVIILSLVLIAETAVAYPFYMSYFNQLAGGPKNGYRYVTDSNADWGQDLKRLSGFIDANKIEKIRVNYFGGGDVKYYLKDKYIDWWDSKRPIVPGFYALSTNYLMGSIYDKAKPDNESYRWTKNFTPISQVGTSIFIYYLTPEEIKTIN